MRAAWLPCGPVTQRDDLVELLTAQVQGEARVTDVVIAGDRGVVRFDVVAEGDTVILPGIELAFDRTPDGTWTTNPDSLCTLAAGVGLTCPPTD